ncbi:hypothetical protein DL93DRAFT_361944 [Clavulina sp. PMI_390]|nr:hypothetical protein DL93DRAFT_361944 [Clavulina sp. PMI_390]
MSPVSRPNSCRSVHLWKHSIRSQSEMLNRCRTLQIVAERHPGAINLHLSSLDVQSTEASELPSTIRLNLEHLPQGRLSVQVSRRDIVKLINIAFRASDGQAQDWSRMERIARKAIATKLAEKLGPNEEDMQKMCISQEGSDIGSILDRLETTCFDSLLREVFEAWVSAT